MELDVDVCGSSRRCAHVKARACCRFFATLSAAPPVRKGGVGHSHVSARAPAAAGGGLGAAPPQCSLSTQRTFSWRCGGDEVCGCG